MAVECVDDLDSPAKRIVELDNLPPPPPRSPRIDFVCNWFKGSSVIEFVSKHFRLHIVDRVLSNVTSPLNLQKAITV